MDCGRRREFLVAVGALLARPLAAGAQQAGKVARIGYLTIGSVETPEMRAGVDAFRQGLLEHGYVEGKNFLIEYRGADGKIERLPGLANELARLKVDVIVAGATPAARAAQQATTTIPIVAVAMGDPVRDGLVASLARPGGNITGSTSSVRSWYLSAWSYSRKPSPGRLASRSSGILAHSATAR